MKKEQRKPTYSDQKQQWQHKHQQNNNNKETVIGRKTTVWILQMKYHIRRPGYG